MIACFLLVGRQHYASSMVEALKAVHGCEVVQMTDLRSEPVAGADRVIRLPFKIPLMLYRLKHLLSFPHDELLIIDTDVIAKHPIEDVWEWPFDVALTLRDQGELYNGDGADIGGDMPFNTGVMLSRSQQFWEDCYLWLEKQSPELQNWYGDQKAVAQIAHRPQYLVNVLACSEFNWAPNSRDDSSNARFWHYKGAVRKKWIPHASSLASIPGRPSLITSLPNPS